jgi:hypothetical protein
MIFYGRKEKIMNRNDAIVGYCCCTKPPLGTSPYSIVAEDRVHKLAEAISGAAFPHSIDKTIEWAREIIFYCMTVKELEQ